MAAAGAGAGADGADAAAEQDYVYLFRGVHINQSDFEAVHAEMLLRHNSIGAGLYSRYVFPMSELVAQLAGQEAQAGGAAAADAAAAAAADEALEQTMQPAAPHEPAAVVNDAPAGAAVGPTMKPSDEHLLLRVRAVFQAVEAVRGIEDEFTMGDYEYTGSQALMQLYFGQYGRWLQNLHDDAELDGIHIQAEEVYATLRDRLPLHADANPTPRESPFVSTTNSLRHAVLAATGGYNPAGVRLRNAQDIKGIPTPPTHVVGQIYVIRVPRQTLQADIEKRGHQWMGDIQGAEPVLAADELPPAAAVRRRRFNGLHPDANLKARRDDEIVWIGRIPAEYVVACVNITSTDVAALHRAPGLTAEVYDQFVKADMDQLQLAKAWGKVVETKEAETWMLQVFLRARNTQPALQGMLPDDSIDGVWDPPAPPSPDDEEASPSPDDEAAPSE